MQTMTKTLLPIAIVASLALGADMANFVSIPAGSFSMGDHSGLGGGDSKHPSDEVPLHTVSISAFSMEKFHVTNQQYAAFLTAWLGAGKLQVNAGNVLLAATGDSLFVTREAVAYSRISCTGTSCTVLDGRENHPVTNVRWKGAIAYSNWLSEALGLVPTYDLATGECDFSKNGIRLPTEAEWEYAALGGLHDPYPIFPWGDDTSATGQYANWQNSGDPWETGDIPLTTPVGFFNGQTHLKSEFSWPGAMTEFVAKNAVNGYGLYDMSGNAWQWVNDWYLNPYYQTSPSADPTGPTEAEASPMPDGKKYKGMRGGNWYNGAEYYGHGRISNRNPSYFRGPLDPNHPYYHIGFRVVTRTQGTTLASHSETVQAPLSVNARLGLRSLQLQVSLSRASSVSLRLYGVGGKVLLAEELGNLPAGKSLREVSLSRPLPSGMVSLVVHAGSERLARTLVNLSQQEE